jgi:UDP-3-O-[3-hydroxymyristoyl] glucosamine N-acyltransferase
VLRTGLLLKKKPFGPFIAPLSPPSAAALKRRTGEEEKMAFSRRQEPSLSYTLKQIADLVGGQVVGDGQVLVSGMNSLAEAQEGEISFFFDRRYEGSLRSTRASALLVAAFTDLYAGPQVVVSRPALVHVKVAGLFCFPGPSFSGISDRALIHKSSVIGRDTTVFPLVYIGEEASIGDKVTLFPGVFVGDRVRIGHRTVIYPNVTILERCIVGNDVTVHAGTVIGSDGFGYAREGPKNVKIPQIGIVQIDDEVEIGANNCIDRATLGKTWIKRGVKTDNLVQIAHNVVVGEDTIIVAQAGIAGSARIGKEVVLGGQVGISDHVHIHDRVMVGSQAGVHGEVKTGEIVSGTPAIPHRVWLRTSGLLPRLPDLRERLRELEKKVKKLESQIKSETAE